MTTHDVPRASRAFDPARFAAIVKNEASGVVAAFERLDAFMRKWQMKCSDLWRLNDLDGDGKVSCDEFLVAMATRAAGWQYLSRAARPDGPLAKSSHRRALRAWTIFLLPSLKQEINCSPSF